MYVLPALPVAEEKSESRLELHVNFNSLFTINQWGIHFDVVFSYSSGEEDKEWEEMVDNYSTYQVKW